MSSWGWRCRRTTAYVLNDVCQLCHRTFTSRYFSWKDSSIPKYCFYSGYVKTRPCAQYHQHRHVSQTVASNDREKSLRVGHQLNISNTVLSNPCSNPLIKVQSRNLSYVGLEGARKRKSRSETEKCQARGQQWIDLDKQHLLWSSIEQLSELFMTTKIYEDG